MIYLKQCGGEFYKIQQLSSIKQSLSFHLNLIKQRISNNKKQKKKIQVEEELVFKFLLIGGPKVGKSAFLLKYVDNLFRENYHPTIGIDFQWKNLKLNDKSIKLQIWDTAGEERYMSLGSSYYKGTKGVFIIYDITNRNSFQETSKWQQQIDEHTNSEVIKILVGNKSDLNGQREVTFEEGQQLANATSMLFIEISAKEGLNVEQAFKNMTLEVFAKLEKDKKEETSQI